MGMIAVKEDVCPDRPPGAGGSAWGLDAFSLRCAKEYLLPEDLQSVHPFILPPASGH